jgi:L-ascorbate metabolism protein UlaG (beta-lactamase superfamily)
MKLINAILKDEALVADMDQLLSDSTQAHCWWLGQSGFLLQWKGKRVLLDPYLSDSLTQKYEHTEKPHTRMSERVIRPDLLKQIDVVSSSHNHTDHLDAETLVPILANNPGIQFIIPEANRAFVADRVNCALDFPTGLNDGLSVQLGEFSFHGIPAKHNEIDRDAQGHCRYMGYVIRFGNCSIYHSGDTLWFDELPELLRPFSVDLALLPINGNKPERKVAGNLDHIEAVKLAKVLGVKTVIPCHYDMFSFNTADVQDFEKEAERAGQGYRVLKGGERFSFTLKNS